MKPHFVATLIRQHSGSDSNIALNALASAFLHSLDPEQTISRLTDPVYRFIRYIDSAFRQEIFDIPITEREPKIEPNSMLDDDGRETMAAIRDGFHTATLSHVPSRTQAFNVTMPPLELVIQLESSSAREVSCCAYSMGVR